MNLTTQPISFAIGKEWIFVEPSGSVASVDVERREVGSIRAKRPRASIVIPQFREYSGEASELPAPKFGTRFLVSRNVFDAYSDRPDILCPIGLGGVGDRSIAGASGALVTKSAVDEDPSTLVVLVGGDPLPALQAIATLRPASVVILVSKQSEPIAQKLRSAVAGLSGTPKPKVQISVIANANDACEVVAALRRLRPGWALSYMGGSKVMAAQARRVYDVLGDGRERHATVVNGALLRDDGTSESLATVPVTLKAIATLHGHRLAGGTNAVHRRDDFAAGQEMLLDRLKSAAAGHPESTWDDKRLSQVPRRARKLITDVGGWWFETLIAAIMASSEGCDEIRMNTRLWVGGSKEAAPELDVLVRSGWTAIAVSCTVERSRKERKLKVLEVAHRARQLGGDQAVAVFVCLGTKAQCESLEADVVNSGLGAQHRVFGLDDVVSWVRGASFPIEQLAMV